MQDLGQREKRQEQTVIKQDEIARVIQSVEGDGLSYHTYEDIGRYTVFPEHQFKRMFPTSLFGNYDKDEYERN